MHSYMLTRLSKEIPIQYNHLPIFQYERHRPYSSSIRAIRLPGVDV
jgi:hypothetical protein